MPTLRPPRYAQDIATAVSDDDGRTLSSLLSFEDAHAKDLFDSSPNPSSLSRAVFRDVATYSAGWEAVFEAHCRVIVAMRDTDHQPCPDFVQAFEAQKALVTAYNELVRVDPIPWSLPVMYTINRELRLLSMEADSVLIAGGGKGGKQEEMIRLVQVGFGVCCSDRSLPSRKAGVKYMATLLFKTYFRLGSLALCKNVIRGVDNAKIDATIEQSTPRAHRITFNYYLGALAFLQEEYDKAETHLESALALCNRSSIRNIELILDFLIPLKLYRGKRLASRFLLSFPRLDEVYRRLYTAIAYGDIEEFDREMKRVEPRLLGRRTYLLVERCRDICLCNLVRVIHHEEKENHQLPLALLKPVAAYPGESLDTVDTEEVECVLANLISQGRLKGYLSHGNKVLVLSKLKPFEPMLPFAS